MSVNYVEVTEVAGDDISREQLARMRARYHWAATYCAGRDVLEVACGTGPGLGFLAKTARSLRAGDISEEMLAITRGHYGDRIPLERIDAQSLPFPDASLDVVILFEAIYYVPDASRFVSEARRVLRAGGTLLIASANRDLFDFNPSPYSHVYYGAADLTRLLETNGFVVSMFGGTSTLQASLFQKVVRFAKKAAVSLGLMPGSMAGKKLLKRLVFGKLTPMPAEIDADPRSAAEPWEAPTPIDKDKPDVEFKVLYCAGVLPSGRTDL